MQHVPAGVPMGAIFPRMVRHSKTSILEWLNTSETTLVGKYHIGYSRNCNIIGSQFLMSYLACLGESSGMSDFKLGVNCIVSLLSVCLLY